jgi:hypothetical protein
MLEAFAHFSLACYASIGENPALSNSDVNWPERMAGPPRDIRGKGSTFQRGQNPAVYRKKRTRLVSTAFSHLWK